jgi:hypothetical protein
MAAAKHVLQYLHGTYDRCLTYSKQASIRHNTLWGWVDSDWAADKETRRSHTGYVLMLNGGAISWKSRRQSSVSLNTSEAEYSMSQRANVRRKWCISVRSYVNAISSSLSLHWCMRIIGPVSLCLKTPSLVRGQGMSIPSNEW